MWAHIIKCFSTPFKSKNSDNNEKQLKKIHQYLMNLIKNYLYHNFKLII